MTQPTDVALDVLAVHRLAHLVTTDVITKPARVAVIRMAYGDWWNYPADEDWEEHVALDDDPPKLATLVTCRWCSSVWAALAVVCLRRVPGWRLVRDALALSSASTLLVRVEP